MIYNLKFTISVSPENNRLSTTITNLGEGQVHFSLTAFNLLMKFTVFDDAGTPVPLSEFGQDLAENDINVSPSSRPAILAPGGSEANAIEIENLFVAVPGKQYTISAEWSVWVFDSFDKQSSWLTNQSAGELLPLLSNTIVYSTNN